jgi:hypothetical protein
MTPLDVLDQKGSDLIGLYVAENELAIVIRTKADDVRVIAPDYSRPYLAKMLRIAASMLEEPVSKQFN